MSVAMRLNYLTKQGLDFNGDVYVGWPRVSCARTQFDLNRQGRQGWPLEGTQKGFWGKRQLWLKLSHHGRSRAMPPRDATTVSQIDRSSCPSPVLHDTSGLYRYKKQVVSETGAASHPTAITFLMNLSRPPATHLQPHPSTIAQFLAWITYNPAPLYFTELISFLRDYAARLWSELYQFAEEPLEFREFPANLSFTATVKRVGQPTASSRDITTKFTLATKGERGKSDKIKHGGHDGKSSVENKRRRPRLSPVHLTQADKRRTQVRLAQRAFRLRQETKIQSLENKVLNMENAISQTTKALLDLERKILAGGVLDQDPEISHSLRVTVETLSLAKAITIDQDSDNNNVENEGGEASSPTKVLGEVEDSVTSVHHDPISSQDPPFKHSFERTARDRTAQASVREYTQLFHQSQQSPGTDLTSSIPQDIRRIRSDNSLNYTTVCKAAQKPSALSKRGDETDLGYINDAATEEPDSVIAGAASVNDKSGWEVKATTINAPRKEKSPVQKAMGRRTAVREAHKAFWTPLPQSRRQATDPQIVSVSLQR
ncbi:hypothetical protein B0O99DRAFT_590564 [Bisporella sp. PMI_857]|nr:hypothetical protein B0O99DRAFT_590564 [Bisporella sp. PMI_857]